jgi:hypothetical protein
MVIWNVNVSLLTLQQWSPSATLGELMLKRFPFWIQVHGLPLANLTVRNAIVIGKGLGNLIKVDDACAVGQTFRSYLRMLAEVDVFEPLKPGFHFHRECGESVWIFLKYKRLDIYCTNCGRIGHKNQSCKALLMILSWSCIKFLLR